MRIAWLCALSGVLLIQTVRAGVVDFLASGTFQDGSVLSGTVTIDTTAGVVTAGDLAITGRAVHYTTLNLQRTWPPSSPFLYEVEFLNGQATDNDLTFLFPPVSLVGYSGGILCGISTTCHDATLSYFSNLSTLSGGFTSNFIELDSGSLGAPEPSAGLLILPGLGLVMAGARRRRLG
jgi:hypothetical protein